MKTSISTRTQITIGQVLLLVTILLSADVMGLIPDRRQAVREGRANLCEALTLQASGMITRGKLEEMHAVLTATVARNDELLSVAIRRMDGTVDSEVGEHRNHWEPMSGDFSTDQQIQIPLTTEHERWGTIEFRFRPISSGGLLGMLQSPSVRLVLFVTLVSFISFRMYLGRMLKSLDPSKAIPSRVKDALDTLAEGLVVLDQQHRIVLANQAFASVFDRPPQGLLGKKLNDLPWVSPDDTKLLEPLPWVQALEEQRALPNRLIRIAVDSANPRTFQTNCSPVLGHDGNYRGVLVSFDDITQLEQQKTELKHSKDAADVANRAKSDFLANMSHEIRTPMNAILGFTDLLRRGFADNEQQRKQYLDTIHRSGNHLLGLINDILDLSKVEAGRLEIESAPCPVHQVCRDVIMVMSVKAKEKGIALHYETAGAIPETIHSDGTRLRQILMNLIGNAIKFTGEGEVRLRGAFQESAKQPKLVLEVIDTGIGMSPRALERVFDPFVQADASVTRKYGGTGLGLAICKRFTEAMGGTLEASSIEGKGTTFRFTIQTGSLDGVRFLDAVEAERESVSQIRTESRASIQLPPSRVLVVDDGQENRQLIKLILTKAGVTVEEAEDGQQALERIDQRSYDLILMDMQMPIMDGYTATTSLRKMGYTIPIVALTANAMAEDEERCRAAGCSDFLTKPVDFDQLLQLLADRLPQNSSASTAPENSTQVHAQAITRPSVAPTPDNSDRPSEVLAALLQKTLQGVCEAYFAEDYGQVSQLAKTLEQPAADSDSTDLQSATVLLLQSAKTQDADGIEQAITDLTVLLQSLQVEADDKALASASDPEVGRTISPNWTSGSEQQGDSEAFPLQNFAPLTSSLPLDDPVFQEIVIGFVQRLHQQIAEMQTAWETRNYEQLRFLAHWLKGAGGTMGFADFTAPAKQLEEMAIACHHDQAGAALAELQHLAKQVVAPGPVFAKT